jgi:hypothetical protein
MSIHVNPHPDFAGNIVGISHALGTHPQPEIPTRNFGFEVDVFFSLDAGASWNTRRFSNSERANPALDTANLKHINDGFDPGRRFDPTVSIDSATGFVYIGYSVWDDADLEQWLVVGRSQDGGDTWQFDVVAYEPNTPMGPHGPIAKFDKFHLATGADPSQPNGRAVYITYTDKEGPDVVHVAGTNYSGSNWQDAMWEDVAVSDNSGDLNFPDPAVGPSGELYVAWIDYAGNRKVMIDVDPDGLFVDSPQGFDFGQDSQVKSLISDIQIPLVVPAMPSRGLSSALMLDVDVSSNPSTRGRLYITFIDHRDVATKTNYPHDVDIFVGRLQPPPSGALTGWSFAAIENDTTTDFNPWLDIDQTNGNVWLVYFRSQEKNGGTAAQVHTYVRSSLNGGQTFSQRTRLSAQASNASDVDDNNDYDHDYLEYMGLAAHAGKIHALWPQVNYSEFDAPRGDLEAYYASFTIPSGQPAGRRLVVRADEHGPGAETIKIEFVAPNTLKVTVGNQLQFEGLASAVDEVFIEGLETDDVVVYPFNTQLLAKIHVAPIVKVVLTNPGLIEAGNVNQSEIHFVVTSPPGRYVRLFVNDVQKHATGLNPGQQQAEFVFKVCGRTAADPICQNDDGGGTIWWRGSVDGQVVHVTHATDMAALQNVPTTRLRVGDFNRDAEISAADIDYLIHHIVAAVANADLDFDRDHDVDVADLEEFVNLVLRTYFGDANLDAIFNSTDLVEVLAIGEYEDSLNDNSGWADGDWDGDQDFGTSDLVIAQADGGYDAG